MAHPAADTIDLDRYLSTRVTITNEAGGKGYDQGVRVFVCPLCRDSQPRGWMSVLGWVTGCFNSGCDADPRLPGGAIEWIRRREGFAGRGEVWAFLLEHFTGPRGRLAPRGAAPAPVRGPDWVRFPPETRWLRDLPERHPHRTHLLAFASRQWSLSPEAAVCWNLGGVFTREAKYGHRVVIPIQFEEQIVAFQARTWNAQRHPKYLTARWGPEDDPENDCGRPARALLFNYDAVLPGGQALLVEGPGDVMGWHQTDLTRYPTGCAILGTALTPEKLSLLASRQLTSVVVALDPDLAAQQRALQYLEDLQAWSIPAMVGWWRGGKDAGSGATLEVVAPTGPFDIGAKLRARLELRTRLEGG